MEASETSSKAYRAASQSTKMAYGNRFGHLPESGSGVAPIPPSDESIFLDIYGLSNSHQKSRMGTIQKSRISLRFGVVDF